MKKYSSRILLLLVSITLPPNLHATPIEVKAKPEIKAAVDFRSLIAMAKRGFKDEGVASITVKDSFYMKVGKDPKGGLVLGLAGFEKVDPKDPISEAPVFGGVAYYQKVKEKYVLKNFESLGEYFAKMEKVDLIGDGQKEVVLYTGSGNHGAFLDVYQMVKDGLRNVCHVDGYGYGPGTVEENGKALVVDFKNSFINACEACQISHEQVYHWDGTRFQPEPDPLGDCIDEYYKSMEDKDHETQHLEQGMACMESYLKEHPDSFAAVANCVALADELHDPKKSALYKKRLEKMDPNKVSDCPHCDPELKSQFQKNQARYLGLE